MQYHQHHHHLPTDLYCSPWSHILNPSAARLLASFSTAEIVEELFLFIFTTLHSFPSPFSDRPIFFVSSIPDLRSFLIDQHRQFCYNTELLYQAETGSPSRSRPTSPKKRIAFFLDHPHFWTTVAVRCSSLQGRTKHKRT